MRRLETALLSNGTLAELYRFAWLLTGEASAAEDALAKALTEVEPHLDALRSAMSRNAWLARRIRKSCLAAMPPTPASGRPAPRLLRDEALAPLEILEIEAYIVAQRFHSLAEPERSALALFYLDLLPPAESAKLLDLSLEDYYGTLGRARLRLHEGLTAGRPDTASTP